MTAGGATTTGRLVLAADDIPVDVPRVPAREAAQDELSDPMYHEHDPNLLERGLDRFWDWVGDLFDGAAGAAPGGSLGLVVIMLIIAGLVAALWWRLGTPQRVARPPEALFGGAARSAADHRKAAQAHADAHRWTEAVQERMRALVRALEDRAVLDPRPGRTADEAASEAGRALPAHASRLRSAARVFDDVTYGGRTADAAAYQDLSALDRDIEAAKPLLAAGTTREAPR
ncbi:MULTISPECIES: DUF4129 domain-containing protein [Streptomyces]|uniref:DUF4129 domain-containing protein n=2 Tax=Streptomyces TaxID=1883 RepID=A0ABU2RCQ9_9ACTN|nr:MULTISPECIES: DUF4129 domain-containing protein [unclassified Streptomyces]MBK3593614.1 DUF4129 domain-containing protein [Streptomyces sp. MBT51]MDT0426048.1 DUF4129 domain-containing protein [Streptomyces sp. DSM 41770]